MAKLFLESTDTTYKVSSANTKVYGATGDQVVTVDAAATGVTFDANVEGVSFSGATSDFTYKQLGLTDLGVYKAGALFATVAIQDDATGSLLTFSNGTVATKFVTTGGVTGLTFGGTAVSATSNTTVTPATIDATTGNGSTSTPVTGSTFTLTVNGDTFDPTNATAAYKTTTGDDTFRAPSNTNLDSADFIDGGAGTDALTAAITAGSQTIAPMIKNVESITLTVTSADAATFKFDATDVTGANTVTIKNAGATSADRTGPILGYATTSDELILVSGLAKTTTLGIIGGTDSASDGVTAADITGVWASAAAADTQNVAISTLGKVGILTLATAETVSIAATGTGTTGANAIGLLSADAVKTLNITGSGDLTIGVLNLATTVTVNAAAATGVIGFTGEATAITKLTFTGGTGATTVTAGASGQATGTAVVTTNAGADTVDVTYATIATVNVGDGNDSVIIGAQANITAADSIVGGAGTDKIVITDATINATTKTTLALGVSGFEVVKTTAALVTTIDFNALSSYDIVEVAGVLTGLAVGGGATSANTGAAGLDAVTATIENADTLILSSDIVGPAGGTTAGSGGRGGDAITLTPRLDNGSNVANLTLYGDVDLTGGIGGAAAAAGSTAGSGDSAIDAVSIEVLNIKLQGTQATAAEGLAFAAGAAGATGGGSAGSAGDTVVVGSNATINVTDELVGTATKYNNLDMGTVAGQNVTINASTFHGTLKVGVVSSGAGNVGIYGGSAEDTLTGGTGADVISGGAGSDVITGGTGLDVLTGGAGADTFVYAASTTDTPSSTVFDEITDYGLGSDIIDFGATLLVKVATSGSTSVATTALITNGIASFNAADDTLAEKIVAVNAGLVAGTEADGQFAIFTDGSDTYLYILEDTSDSVTSADVLIKLTGVAGATATVTSGDLVIS